MFRIDVFQHEWLIVAVVAVIVVWGVLQFGVIRDAPREMDFGTFRDVPGESPYSTAPAPSTDPVPRQMEPLPEARPKPSEEGSP